MREHVRAQTGQMDKGGLSRAPAHLPLAGMLAEMAWDSADTMALSWLDGRGIIDVNNAFQQYFGVSREELIGRPGADVGFWLDAGDRAAVSDAVARGVPLDGVPVRLRTATGELRIGHLWARRYLLPVGPVGVFLLKDATEAVRAEQMLALQRTAAELLGDGQTGEIETAARLMAQCGERLGWDVGAYWRPDPVGRMLRCRAVWQSPYFAAPAFTEITLSLTLAYGQDLPGLVWTEREPVWLQLTQNRHLVRGSAALHDGLHTALGFPVLTGREVAGVFELFSQRVEPVDDVLRQTAVVLGRQFGLFLRAQALS